MPTDLRFVRAIKAPIVYILAGATTIVPPETQEELKRTLPQVEIVTMPGLRHYPSDERPGYNFFGESWSIPRCSGPLAYFAA